MNLTLTYNDLPKVEREVADLYACGHTKKEIAMKRGRSLSTVNNQISRLFEKSNVRKDTEFTTWYFCTRFHISYDLLPIHRSFISIALLILITLSVLFETNPLYRARASRQKSRTELVRRIRRNDELI